MSVIDFCLAGFLVVLAGVVIRLAFVLPALKHHQPRSLKPVNEKSIMTLLGSGGHTGEMIRILSTTGSIHNAKEIYWVISSGDSSSAIHLGKFQKDYKISNSQILELPRARKVGEGFISSIQSTIKTIITIFLRFTQLPTYPDILIVNGPGTCVPICYYFFVMKFLGLAHTKILYIESLARVNDLSLSGKLCYLISDRFIVQWEKLQTKYPNAEWFGILV